MKKYELYAPQWVMYRTLPVGRTAMSWFLP